MGLVGLVAPRAFGIERDNLLLNGVDGPPAPPLLVCFPHGPAQRLHRRRVRAERHMLLPLLDIETTGFSRRRHEITVIGTIVYDAAARAEREHRCFNIFCVRGADTRSRDAVASMKRDVDSLLDRCDAVVAYIGIQFDLWIRQWQLQNPARGSGGAAADVAPAGAWPTADPGDALARRRGVDEARMRATSPRSSTAATPSSRTTACR